MCGIVGAIGDLGIGPEALGFALRRLQHRGPDDEGTHLERNCVLGMRRLSIVDVQGGHQPIYNEDRTVAIVFNGEVYNYKELMAELIAEGHTFRTASDTETLVHLYETLGEKMVTRLRGMFAFAIWDVRRQRLFLGRDRFGKKPLYYCRAGKGLLFASELKALRELAGAAGVDWSVAEQSIHDYLSLGFIPQPATIYREVSALPPASWLTCGLDGAVALERYWQLSYFPKNPIAYDDALAEIRRRIRESVRLRLRSDVPVGLFLSGGIDSTVIAYEVAALGAGNIETFTFSVGAHELDEAPLAQRTAEFFGLRNSVLEAKVDPCESVAWIARHYDQPFADSSAIPTHAISRAAASQVKVVLTGDGGDELFAGYRRYRAAQQLHRLEWAPRIAGRAASALMTWFVGHRRSTIGLGARFLRGALLPEADRYLVWTTDMLREGDKTRLWRGGRCAPTEKMIAQWLAPDLPHLERLMAADIQAILLSDLLVKMDMATMAQSLEARSPLLDHELAEFVASLPGDKILRGGDTKTLLRDAYRGRIPREIATGAKRGFEIPMATWLRGELQAILMDTVGQPDARILRYVDGDWVKSLLDRKTMIDRNWSYLVYSLLILELWLRHEETHRPMARPRAQPQPEA